MSNQVSLDGYFEGPGKKLDWFVVDDEFNEYAKEMFVTVDTILLGRTTYEMFADYWPAKTINDDPVAGYMNSIPKIVFSKTLENASWGDWNNATLVKKNIRGEINKLKQKPGRDMVIFGSGKIVSKLTDLGLIDEYRLIINPVILGKGKPLFKGLHEKVNLNFLKAETFKNGVVILYYELKKT